MASFIDLHMHSTASDGTVKPEEIIELVRPEQYDYVVLALTDHDCTDGIAAFRAAAKQYPNVDVIAGVEISTDYLGKNIHILGLGIDPTEPVLSGARNRMRESRDNRNEKILQKLREQGIIVPHSVIETTEDTAVGRPHIAAYLKKMGYVESIEEAFQKYLGTGACCSVPREKLSPEETIRSICGAGGIAVLAHPLQYKLPREKLEAMIEEWIPLGLRGIEVYYTEFTDEEIAYLESLADKYKLIRTGGSDFHGENKPSYQLGFGWGNLDKTFDKIEYETILKRQNGSF